MHCMCRSSSARNGPRSSRYYDGPFSWDFPSWQAEHTLQGLQLGKSDVAHPLALFLGSADSNNTVSIVLCQRLCPSKTYTIETFADVHPVAGRMHCTGSAAGQLKSCASSVSVVLLLFPLCLISFLPEVVIPAKDTALYLLFGASLLAGGLHSPGSVARQ